MYVYTCKYYTGTVEGVGLFFDQLQNDPVKRAAYLRPYGKNKSTLLFGACWNKRADIAQVGRETVVNPGLSVYMRLRVCA